MPVAGSAQYALPDSICCQVAQVSHPHIDVSSCGVNGVLVRCRCRLTVADPDVRLVQWLPAEGTCPLSWGYPCKRHQQAADHGFGRPGKSRGRGGVHRRHYCCCRRRSVSDSRKFTLIGIGEIVRAMPEWPFGLSPANSSTSVALLIQTLLCSRGPTRHSD